MVMAIFGPTHLLELFRGKYDNGCESAVGDKKIQKSSTEVRGCI